MDKKKIPETVWTDNLQELLTGEFLEVFHDIQVSSLDDQGSSHSEVCTISIRLQGKMVQ